MTKQTVKWVLGALGALAFAAILVRTVAPVRGASGEEEEGKNEEAIKSRSRMSVQNGQTVITLDSETRSRAGIAVAPLEPITARAQATAPAVVLSAQELVGVRNSYVAAQAALKKARATVDVAQKEYERLAALYQDNQNASQKDLESAQGILRSDRADAEAARQELSLQAAAARQSWGDVVARWVVDGAEALDRILDQRDSFVQVTRPWDQRPSAPQNIELQIAGSKYILAKLVSTFPRIDPRIQGVSYLYIAQNRAGLAPGMNLVAHLQGGPSLRGVLVPRSAVVWWQGSAWVYLETAPGRFTRRQVPTDTPLTNGLFVAKGFAVGDRVVVVGGQTLLSEEFGSQLPSEE